MHCKNMGNVLLRRPKRFTREMVFGIAGEPYMVLEKYDASLISDVAKASKSELKELLEKNADSSCTWGYFPQFCSDTSMYTESIKLSNTLMENVIKNLSELEQVM